MKINKKHLYLIMVFIPFGFVALALFEGFSYFNRRRVSQSDKIEEKSCSNG